MSERFPTVWYASPEKAASVTKFFVFEDRGALEVSPNEIIFEGKKRALTLRDIVNVTLTRQRFPWVAYLLANLVVVAYEMLTPVGRLSVEGVAVLLVAANLLAIVMSLSQRWVLIEYRDESGQERRVYFADGSANGWGSMFGRTTRLFRGIEEEQGR